MKKILMALSLATILLASAACTNNVNTPTVEPTAPISSEQPAQATAPISSEQPTQSPAVEATPAPEANGDEISKAYREALNNLIENHVFPDGTQCEFDEASAMSEDSFAIYDVDGDGKDELIIAHVAAPTAGQVQLIYDYDVASGKFVTELSEYPMLTYFDNGVIRADWSHNQGLAGDFWPFTVYSYDKDSDTYKSVGMVDAWDKNFAEEDANGNKFPDDIDVSGTGLVYYIMTSGEYEAVDPVDVTEFKKWCQETMGNGEELSIGYLELTAENVANIK